MKLHLLQPYLLIDPSDSSIRLPSINPTPTKPFKNQIAEFSTNVPFRKSDNALRISSSVFITKGP